MKNSEKIKIIQYHWNQLKRDCPCVLRASGELQIDDPERIPNDEQLLEWKLEYDNRVDLTDQKAACIQLLNDSDSKIVSDTPYPNDIQVWKDYRTELRQIIKGDKIETIPEKPFTKVMS